MSDAHTRTFEVRHLQLGRALFAALAAVMVTFSGDHSAAVGLSVFSGWAIATALLLLAAGWFVYPAGRRGPAIALGAATIVAGMIAGVPSLRSDATFFAVVIAWAAVAGLIELVAGIRDRGSDESRDRILIGSLTLVLALGTLLVNPAYSLGYVVGGNDYELTGIIIGVGLFGGYAAVVAVFLGIAGLSPRAAAPVPVTTEAPGAASSGGPA